MSNLLTNDGTMLSSIDYQNHTNSRPKFQPIRVKELLHFCESDDDESEDKPQDSDTESDSDDPQPLPQDDSIEDNFNQSLPLFDAKYNNNLKPICEFSQTSVPSKSEELTLVDDTAECKMSNVTTEVHVSIHSNYNNADVYDKSKDSKQDNHKTTWSTNFEVNDGFKSERNLNSEQSNCMQSSSENSFVQDKSFQNEYKNQRITNVDIKRQSSEERTHKSNPETHKSDPQSMDQHNLCKASTSEFESRAFVSQCYGNISQYSGCNLQNANMKIETSNPKSTVNEENAHHENISSNTLLTSDTGPLLNSVDHLALQTPLKHAPTSSLHPEPSFSRRNIIQTPQNKLSDISKAHGLTPATVFSQWSQNNMKRTPLQNKSINFKDVAKHETPRYLSADSRVRQPLADAGSFSHNNVPNGRPLQRFQLSKVNEKTPNVQNELSNKNLSTKTSMVKRIFEASENATQLELDANEQLKETKYSNVEDVLADKGTIAQNKISNNKHVIHSNKDKEILKPVCNDSQNQYAMANKQNQQQEPKRTADSASNVQFSIPPKICKSRQTRTLFVKGKEYLILGTLGQGMSGEVLRVQDLSSLELCAIKCVNLNRMDKDSAQGCLEEISMLHKLQAPCVVKMFDYEIKYPMVYVVMEMGDTDLSRLLKTMSQEKQIPLTMILYYWTEMLTAVKHIHDNGVIHSDLKPANFLLVRGRLKLIDFGIASSMNADMTSVVKNCPIGTLNYISPEALMDAGENSDSPTQNVKYKINFKSDVWSLGCILYSLVYGHTPFHHIRSQWAKVNAITNPKPNIPFPATLPSGESDNKIVPSPPILIDVMRKCLQHDPKARPTVAELLQVEYIPTKEERMLTSTPNIPGNILVKIKHTLNEDEWRQLLRALENRRYT